MWPTRRRLRPATCPLVGCRPRCGSRLVNRSRIGTSSTRSTVSFLTHKLTHRLLPDGASLCAPVPRFVFGSRLSLVEAAGVEPASEAASPGISTSVSGILVLAWRLLPTGSVSASRGDCPGPGPWRPRAGDPAISRRSPVRRTYRRRRPRSRPRGSCLYCLRSEGESVALVGVCERCAVSHAALGSQSRSSTAPSRPDAPTKPNLVAP